MKINLKTKRMGVSYILDNGAYAAKIGNSVIKQPEVIPNCIMKVKSERRRPFVGDQINECRDASGLFYILPFQRGYLVNWDVQKTVWDYMFSKDNGKLSDQPICITEPIYNFQSNQEAMDEIFFEEYDCCGMLRVTAPDLCAYNYSKMHNDCKTLVVIDTGYSFTHIIPFIDGVKYLPGIKRIDVGGKILTNHLKEIISYRQLHVMDETYVINQVKEDACYVSMNFRSDMNQTSLKDNKNKIIREYVLPDYSTIKRGYIRKIHGDDEDEEDREMKKIDLADISFLSSNGLTKPFSGLSKSANGLTKAPNGLIKLSNGLTKPRNGLTKLSNGITLLNGMSPNSLTTALNGIITSPESLPDKSAVEQQTIVLNNERITIPEILFHPSDIGIQQMGIAEAVVDCINDCPEDMKYRLLGNIVVMGGNAMFPNFGKRLYSEVRQRFNEHLTLNVYTPENPITYPWHGGKLLTSEDEFYTYLTAKEEYEEYGHHYTREHLQNFKI